MADKKDDNRSTIDRWTSNGVGVVISPNTPEQQALVDKLNRGTPEKKRKNK